MYYQNGKPLVSIIISTYNRYELAKGAIESALQQSYKNIQIIVVEDGSRSQLDKHITSVNDERIKYFLHNKNKGLAAVRNTGTFKAEGQYICFMDDDDRWLPDKVKRQLSIIKKYEDQKCIVYCNTLRIRGDTLIPNQYNLFSGSMKPYIYNGYKLPQSSIMVSKQNLLNIAGNSEDLISCIDHDLWMKFAQNDFAMDFVNEGLIYHPIHNGLTMTRKLEDRLLGIKQFFDKWKEIVINEYGRTAWKKIEKIYHIQTSNNVIKNYNNSLINKNDALKYFKKLYYLQDTKYTILDNYIVTKCLNNYDAGVYYTPVMSNIRKIIYGISTSPVKRIMDLSRK